MKLETVKVDKAKLRAAIQARIDKAKADYAKALADWESGFAKCREHAIEGTKGTLTALSKAKSYEDLRYIHSYSWSVASKPDLYNYQTAQMEAAIRKLDMISGDEVSLDNREFNQFMQWV
jgi:hypothetical protein